MTTALQICLITRKTRGVTSLLYLMRPVYSSMLILILKLFLGWGGSELAVNILAYQFWNMSDMQGYKRVYFNNSDISFGIFHTLFHTFVQLVMLMNRLHCQFSVKWNNTWTCSRSERSVMFYTVSAQIRIMSYLWSNTDFVKEWLFIFYKKSTNITLKYFCRTDYYQMILYFGCGVFLPARQLLLWLW